MSRHPLRRNALMKVRQIGVPTPFVLILSVRLPTVESKARPREIAADRNSILPILISLFFTDHRPRSSTERTRVS
jgi:hypothetical protein